MNLKQINFIKVMEASFISQNNVGVGSFVSSFNFDGEISDDPMKPGYLVHMNINPSFASDKKRVLNLRIEPSSAIEENELDTNYEIIMLWVNVPIPPQRVEFLGDKIYFNRNFSGLDLIKKIKYFDGSETNFKEHSRLTYKLELQNLLGSNFNSFHDKYLDLSNRLTDNNTLYNETPGGTLYFPIFFRPHLKPFLLDHSSNSCVFRIEIIFNEISKLFTKSFRASLNDNDLGEATCTLVAKFYNDQIVQSQEPCIIESDTSFQNILPVNVKIFDADKTSLNRYDIEFGVKENLVNNVIFSMDDQYFSSNYLFYGKTVNESIKCYLNSCLMLEPPDDDCVNLSKFDSIKKKGWSAQIIDSTHVLLSYTDKGQSYTTLLVSKKIPFEKLDQIYINLQVSPRIRLYWFRRIELDFDYYDKFNHILTNDKYYGGQKILNGQFKVEKTKKIKRQSDEEESNEEIEMEKEIVLMGVESFSFNYNIPTDWKNPGFIEESKKTDLKENQYLTQKHFDVYFSLPVESIDHSPFASLDFLILDFCDYNWMDLDGKHEWEIERISIKSKLNTNLSILFSRDMLNTMRFNQPFNLPQLTITTSKMLGYCNLKDYLFTVEYRNSEFFEIKYREELPIQKLNLSCIISKNEYFSYKNLKYQKLKMDQIKRICENHETEKKKKSKFLNFSI